MTLADVCTHLYTETQGKERREAFDYLLGKIAHPDKGSEFEKKLGKARFFFRMPGIGRLAARVGMWYLQRQEYDVFLLESDNKVIGHTGFQSHPNGWHIFSVEVDSDYRGKGLAQLMIEDFIKKDLVLIDFFANWCMPCLMMAPIINDLSKKFKGKIEFGKVNIEDNQELANEFNIVSIPNFILFKDGKQIEQFIGSMPFEKFEKKLQPLI